MRIRNLTMKNYRGFEDATVDLDRPLTVLFGVNGSGKSSVLEACALALSRFLRDKHAFTRPSGSDGVWRHYAEGYDIRRGADMLSVVATVSNAGIVREAHVQLRTGEAPGVVPNVIGEYLDLYRAAPMLSVFYGAARDVARAKDAFSLQQDASSMPTNPASATQDALVAGSLRFLSLFQWFKEREDVENELKVAQHDLSLEDPQLSAVRRATARMLPGFSGLRIQRDPLHMVIRKGESTLMLDQLSDGERLFLVLTADLARRLAITYAKQSDPLEGEAIVLIDEIELHLHPSWQRRVLGALRQTFPNCQFIVTTHSPQVLSEVPNDAVILVKDFQFTRPGVPTAGRDSNAILAEAMDTPERPAVQAEAIRAISTLLDDAKYDEARAKLDALAQDLTERDRDVVGLRTMLHFLEDGDEAHPQGS